MTYTNVVNTALQLCAGPIEF